MKLPQFTIRDLIVSTAMIVIGIGAPLSAINLNITDSWQIASFAFSWLAAATMIGTGIFVPSKQPALAVMVGLLLLMSLLLALAAFVK